MEEYNKSYGANNHTSLLSHAQSQSGLFKIPYFVVWFSSVIYGEIKRSIWF